MLYVGVGLFCMFIQIVVARFRFGVFLAIMRMHWLVLVGAVITLKRLMMVMSMLLSYGIVAIPLVSVLLLGVTIWVALGLWRTMQMAKKSSGKIPRFVAFTTLTYPENPDWDSVFIRCDTLGYPYAYCIHDRDLKGELDKPEEWQSDKVHCQSIVRVPYGMTVSAFSKKMGIEERWVQGLSSYKDYCRYINHSDEESIRDPRKVCYPTDRIVGSMADVVVEEIENHVTRNQARSNEDDTNIIKILDFIDEWDYLPMNQLIRWCCESGYYSTLRRASGLIRDAVYEHNKSAQHSVAESLLMAKVRILEQRVTKSEKELERAYGDFWERQKNPWTGKTVEEDKRFTNSISDMQRLISEIGA